MNRKNKINKDVAGGDNALFVTKTIIDQDEFKRFQKYFLNSGKYNFFSKLLMVLLVILVIIISYFKHNYKVLYLVVASSIIYPIVLAATINWQIKKKYEHKKKINELVEEFKFYNDNFVSKLEKSCIKISYDEVLKCVETKKNFYLFMKDNQAFIIIKNNLDDVGAFREFMKEKVNYEKR